MILLVTTTAESHDKIDDSNSALLYAKQPMNTDSKAIELKLTLPETFKADVSALFVKHTKNSGKVYYYKPEVSERVLTFVNPHGFSEFEVYTDTRSGKIVFSDGAGTKEYTPANIGESLPVAEKSGYKFNGWKIDGKTYTELTDSLLTLISGDSDKTVEATADFTKKSSSGGGGGGGGSSSSTKYEIKVSSTENGKISISSDKASKGSKITVTVTPDNGYKTESVTVKDTDGNKINVTDAGNKKYTFSMPGKSVTVKAEFIKDDKQEKEEPKEEEKKPDTLDQDFRFSDVNTGAWYYNAVFYAVSNGLMSGISDNKFAPDDTLTRAMLVQVLYNMEGRPETAGGSNFSDVAENVWYAKAVEWAQENKIISGIDENTFAPDTAVTREQTASILCRYAGFKGLDITADADLTVFTDNQNISTWAETSVKWAVANKILNGSGTELEPLAGTTRAQMAQILMSFCKMM